LEAALYFKPVSVEGVSGSGTRTLRPTMVLQPTKKKAAIKTLDVIEATRATARFCQFFCEWE
jgi:hypothetical protein